MKAVIFGAGSMGHQIYHKIKHRFDNIVFVDNNVIGVESGHEVLPATSVKELDFDRIFIASRLGADDIYHQLTSQLGVDGLKIDKTFLEERSGLAYLRSFETRNRFLETFSKYAYSRMYQGAVAEVGVSRGDFAREINRCFPDRRLYLFDTFEGFDKRDMAVDARKNDNYEAMKIWMESVGNLADTSVKTVNDKLPHSENVVFKKGYFPDTFDIGDESFCFVNLDVDLYKPTKAGLELFYTLIVGGG